MMDAIRQWLMGMACAAMAAALAQSLAPEGGPRRICRMAGSRVLLLAMVSPLLQLDEGALSRLAREYQAQAGGYTQTLEEENRLRYESIIEAQSAAYIVDKAAALGISCQAEVVCRCDGEDVPCPYQVQIRGEMSQEQRQLLAQLLESDLGIPPQRQQFEEKGS